MCLFKMYDVQKIFMNYLFLEESSKVKKFAQILIRYLPSNILYNLTSLQVQQEKNYIKGVPKLTL